MIKKIIYIFSLFFLISCSAPKVILPPVVEIFEPNKYLGKWYEIARYDHHFQERLINVEALYSKASPHTIEIENSGVDSLTGEIKRIKGIGYIDDKLTKGEFEISFFMPIYSKYRIIYIDQDYQNAIVSGDSYNYLWILSRNKYISPEKLDELLYYVDELGYNRNRLIHNIQK